MSIVYKTANGASRSSIVSHQEAVLYNGNCEDLLAALPDASIGLIVTSPPYCIGKEYESGARLEDFVVTHARLMPEIQRVLRPGGSVCWQVGANVSKNVAVPLDYLVYDAVREHAPEFVLRNRIIWHFGHGQHCDRRFSGRYETINWFTRGDGYYFDLDAVRIPQRYPGKKASRGPRAGEFSGNPAGKNPSDVWEIPNVKANHVEKTAHPCQFPVALASRLIGALAKPTDIVLDPFAGVSSTGVACIKAGRKYLGAETNSEYVAIGAERMNLARRGKLRVRDDIPVLEPDLRTAVATPPAHFLTARMSLTVPPK